jgi:hypothetical protein
LVPPLVELAHSLRGATRLFGKKAVLPANIVACTHPFYASAASFLNNIQVKLELTAIWIVMQTREPHLESL